MAGANKKGMSRNHRCKHCGIGFAMEWAKTNHETHCKKNPNRGKRTEA